MTTVKFPQKNSHCSFAQNLIVNCKQVTIIKNNLIVDWKRTTYERPMIPSKTRTQGRKEDVEKSILKKPEKVYSRY